MLDNWPVLRADEIDSNQLLIEALQSGEIYATRDTDGALRFHHVSRGGLEDALPMREVIAELSRDLN